MKLPRWFGAVLLSLAVGGPARAHDVDALIRQMGSDQYARRARAMAELQALGAPALEPLRKASKADDLETARRAGVLIRRIEDRLLLDQVLAPKQLRLRLESATVLEAVEALAKESGYQLPVAGDRAAVADRRVTLDTGTTSFWQALDRLAAQGQLTLPPAPAPAAPTNAATATIMARARFGKVSATIQSTNPMPVPERVNLTVGPPARYVSYAGAVRVELRLARPRGKDEDAPCQVILEASAEPRLQNFTLVGAPDVQRAVDEQGRALSLAEPSPPPTGATGPQPITYSGLALNLAPRRQLVLELRPEEPAPRVLKELTGVLPARVSMPNEVLARLDAAGLLRSGGPETVEAKNGGTFTVHAFEAHAGGAYRVRLVLDNVGPNPLAPNLMLLNGNVVALAGGFSGALPTTDLPELRDARGLKYRAEVWDQNMRLNNNQFRRDLTILYRPQPGQGEPHELVYLGSRSVMVPVPFAFRDVSLE